MESSNLTKLCSDFLQDFIQKNIIDKLVDYLKDKKGVELTKSDLDSVFSGHFKLTKRITPTRRTSNVKDDERCVYVGVKAAMKGKRCAKRARVNGYCTQHKKYAEPKKKIEKKNTLSPPLYVKPGTSESKIVGGNSNNSNNTSNSNNTGNTSAPTPNEKIGEVGKPANPKEIIDKMKESADNIFPLFLKEKLFFSPKMKRIFNIDDDDKVVWLYKYEKGEWKVPSDTEIDSMDVVNNDYNKFNDYKTLKPEEKRKNLVGKVRKSDYITVDMLKELGLVG